MPNSNDVASNEMLWERVLSLLVVSACWYRRYHHCFTDFRRGARRIFDCDHVARNRHSDNDKFCNDLNGPKTAKMSERPLKTPQGFPTSKLNTTLRCLLPSAAVHAAVSNNNLRRLHVPDLHLLIGLCCAANPFDRRSRGAQSASAAI
jgi:hypothetical protein